MRIILILICSNASHAGTIEVYDFTSLHSNENEREVFKIMCPHLNNSTTCATLFFNGKIVEGDAKRLNGMFKLTTTFNKNSAQKKMRIGSIYFDSNGDSLLEAIKIGRIIREHLMTTGVFRSHKCYSACVFAVLGGVIREPYLDTIGIHSFYSNDLLGAKDYKKASQKYDSISKFVEKYLVEMRIPLNILEQMKLISYDSLKIIGFDEMESFGVLGEDPVFTQMQSKKIE